MQPLESSLLTGGDPFGGDREEVDAAEIVVGMEGMGADEVEAEQTVTERCTHAVGHGAQERGQRGVGAWGPVPWIHAVSLPDLRVNLAAWPNTTDEWTCRT